MSRNMLCLSASFLLAVCFVLTGCASDSSAFDDAQSRQMIELLMPAELRVVEPFTGFQDFDGDNTIDGLEIRLQPVDQFGDPIKIAGIVRIELYAFEQASGNPEGRRLSDPWEVELLTKADQQRYWDRITGMYRIPVEMPVGAAMTGSKFVLRVYYNTPLADRMIDETILELSQTGPRPRR